VAVGAQAGTVTSTYTPFGADGWLAPGITIDEVVTGSCGDDGGWRSNVADRAFRCSTDTNVKGGGNLFDPCYPEARRDDGTATVLCPRSPSFLAILRIEVPVLADTDLTETQRLPWALMISGGRTCVLSSGATSSVRGKRINYICSGRGLRMLVGAPRRGTATWTIPVVRNAKGAGYRWVKIRRAWY
jgi:hypothetical protein